jgi:hypothetical protein
MWDRLAIAVFINGGGNLDCSDLVCADALAFQRNYCPYPGRIIRISG